MPTPADYRATNAVGAVPRVVLRRVGMHWAADLSSSHHICMYHAYLPDFTCLHAFGYGLQADRYVDTCMCMWASWYGTRRDYKRVQQTGSAWLSGSCWRGRGKSLDSFSTSPPLLVGPVRAVRSTEAQLRMGLTLFLHISTFQLDATVLSTYVPFFLGYQRL